MTRDEAVAYWVDSSDADFEVTLSLIEKNHYVWALFLEHLVLEKLLKAYYVRHTGIDVPYTHDLTKIAEMGKLSLSEDQKDFLDEVTTFNIKARYPDYKNRFAKKATKEFAEKYMEKIKEFRLWLKGLMIPQ